MQTSTMHDCFGSGLQGLATGHGRISGGRVAGWSAAGREAASIFTALIKTASSGAELPLLIWLVFNLGTVFK